MDDEVIIYACKSGDNYRLLVEHGNISGFVSKIIRGSDGKPRIYVYWVKGKGFVEDEEVVIEVGELKIYRCDLPSPTTLSSKVDFSLLRPEAPPDDYDILQRLRWGFNARNNTPPIA